MILVAVRDDEFVEVANAPVTQHFGGAPSCSAVVPAIYKKMGARGTRQQRTLAVRHIEDFQQRQD